MLKNCPDPVDVQDLQFKLQCRLKIFDNKDLDLLKSSSLLSCASRYGLLFAGSSSPDFQAIQIKCIEDYTPKDKDISNYPRRTVTLPSPPKHICVNCDSTILAVVIEKDKCPTVIFYDILSFLKQNILTIKEARLSPTPGVYVTETNWNPALPPIFTACKSDGTLGVYEIKDNSLSINELPAAAEATSFCWSPKGKQIAVGSRNGKITQYKPDLKAVKVINEPPLGGVHSLISIQWVSNYQFIGIYQSADPEGVAKLIVVDAPKTGEVTYTNYEDVCYSGMSRLPQFYMILQQHWNILMVASANSTELGVLTNTGDTWTQCIISDSARAELPLSSDHQETLPVGLALDISSTKPIPWNESSIPPCPYLLILSDQGLLCIFNVVNLRDGVPSICTPPDPVSDTSGITQFVIPSSTVSILQNVPVTTKATAPTFSFAPAQATPVSQVNQPPAQGSKVLTQPQPAFVVPSSLFGAKTAENKALFGGQATLTPISPQQPTTQVPLFGGQTLITPINKVPTGTPAVSSASADKYSSIIAAVNAPVSAPVSIPTKPIIISTPTATKGEVLGTQQQQVVQPKPTVSSVKPPEPKSGISINIKGEKDALLAQMIREECLSLETELKTLLQQGKSSNVNVGTENEKFDMVMRIESLQEFVKEIVDISLGENAEVHYLKQNLIQCWAWFEEAQSRYNSSKDEAMSLLLRSQPLDSATEKRQQDMSKLMYYLESQIAQASKALDEQWDNFQDYAKKTHRIKMPTMETIFQTMVRQNVVLQKQSYILKDIANRLKSKSQATKGPSLLLSLENTKDLNESLKQLQLDGPQDIYQLQYERVLKRMKNLSTSKTVTLRNLLKSRNVHHVTAVKPQLSSSIIFKSPESKTKHLVSNLLASSTQVSPFSKVNALPRQLNFVHSTPIRDPSADIKPTETPPNTPQLDHKTFTFKKIDNSSAMVTTASTFGLPIKTAPSFTNLSQGNVNQPTLPTHSLSAFVPTTQVTFSASTTSKPFSFTPAVTTATTVLKTDAVSTETTLPAFSLGATASTVQKFGATPKTTNLVTPTASTPKTAPTVKSSLPQFNFGNSITITPVISKKSDPVATTTTFTAATTKSAFNFSSASTFASKVEPSATSKPETAPIITSSTSLFGGLPQSGKSLFGSTPSPATFSFGGNAGTSKISAFTAVTTNVASSTVTIPTSTVSTPVSKPDVSVSSTLQPSIFANNATATSSMFGNLANTASTTTTGTTKPVSMFGSTVSATKPQSFFGTSPTSMTITTLAPATSTSFFGNLPATKPDSVVPASTSITTLTAISATTTPSISSSTPVTTVSTVFTPPAQPSSTTAESSKPSTASVSATFDSSAPAASTSIFGTSTASTTKPSQFGTSATSQGSIFGTSLSPKTSQTSIFGSSTNTTQPSIFGSSTNTTQPSIFGSSINTTQPSIFGTSASTTTTGSIFGGTATILNVQSSGTSTTSSIFATTSTPTTQPSVFGKPMAATTASVLESTTTTTAPSIFANTITPASTAVFGTTQSAIFGNTTAGQPAVFGTSTAPTTTSSIFGGTTTTQSTIFQTPISSASTKPSIFGATTSSMQPPTFGATAPVSTQQSSIFGSAASSNQSSIFGTSATTQGSVFGGVTASTTKPSIFGATASAVAPQSSVFAVTSVPSTQPSLFPASTAASPFGTGFGAAATTASTSPFGQSTSIFGTPKTTESPFGSTFGNPSVFGATPVTTATAFGQPAAFGGSSPSVFGTPTTSTNIFGSAGAGSTFGTVSSSGNVFGAPAVSSSSFSFAGAASNTGNAGSFGFGNLNVGNAATTSGSIFGGGSTFGSASPQANPFGRTTEQKSPFGGSSSIFGSPASTSSSAFSTGTGSIFGSNAQSGFGTTTFGPSSTFGQQQSTFGQNTFGNTSFGNASGPFSSGGTAVGQTGFGSPTNFQKPSGFGSPPVFGGSPQAAFGAAPSFGGSPAFGAPSAFGSPNKVFGSNTPTGFGGATTTPTAGGFGNLANQNTVGFGSLAQQAGTANATPFAGSSSFSSWR